MIETIFLDFDGVIRHWHGSEIAVAEQACDVPKGTLFQQAFAKPLLLPAITGQVTHRQWQERVEQELAAQHTVTIAKRLIAAWNGATYEIDRLFLKQIGQIAPAVEWVLVTNATDWLDQDLADSGLHGRFHHIVNSSVIGTAKPDEMFYTKALEIAQTTAEKSIFIDDSAQNVAAAKVLGFHAWHHTNNATTVTFIEQYF